MSYRVLNFQPYFLHGSVIGGFHRGAVVPVNSGDVSPCPVDIDVCIGQGRQAAHPACGASALAGGKVHCLQFVQ